MYQLGINPEHKFQFDDQGNLVREDFSASPAEHMDYSWGQPDNFANGGGVAVGVPIDLGGVAEWIGGGKDQIVAVVGEGGGGGAGRAASWRRWACSIDLIRAEDTYKS